MTADFTNWIKHNLKAYEDCIRELDENFDKIKERGRYQADSPLRFKYEISFSINHLEKENADLMELEIEYERVNKKFMEFVERRDKAYLEKLYEELKNLVTAYPTTTCLFLELDPIDIETGHDLYVRDAIEFMIDELETEYDLHDIKVKVAALDEVLKCRFRLKIDTIVKECPCIEREYFPDSFWWRHPSKILREKEESLKRSSAA